MFTGDLGNGFWLFIIILSVRFDHELGAVAITVAWDGFDPLTGLPWPPTDVGLDAFAHNPALLLGSEAWRRFIGQRSTRLLLQRQPPAFVVPPEPAQDNDVVTE